MKTRIFVPIAALLITSLHAATPDQEKTFVAAYKTALVANDEKVLASFLSTDGATAQLIGFFKSMQMLEPGSTVVSIELITPDAAELAKLTKPLKGPDGRSYKLPLKPVRELVLKAETKTDSSSSTSTSTTGVAEKDGKLVIPVPVPAQ